MDGVAVAVREVAGEAYGESCPEEREGDFAAVPAEASEADDHSDADELDDLGDEIARLAAHIHAATRRLLHLAAEFDRRGGWQAGGHASCAHWLSFRTGCRLSTAREQLRVARALETLPRTGDAMGRGRLSLDQVRSLTRVAEPEGEAELVALAEGATPAQLARMVRGWKKGSRQDEAARERERHRLRRLVVFSDDEGMVGVKGRLMPEAGALFRRALEAAEDALFRTEDRADGDASYRQRRRRAARRRADAAGLMAERALAAGFGGEGAPVSGPRAERFQVFLHVDRDTLSEDGEPGRSELGDGTRISPESSRRLACDASVVGILRGPEGEVLDVGRKRRTTPPAIRRALEVRDRGCRFPGCGLRFTAAHHIHHWADGGRTSLENCVLLCRRHHRLVHEGGWRVEWWGKRRAVFRDPGGGIHLDERPAVPELGEAPGRELVAQNRRRGVDPGPLDAGARWKRERDIPDQVYFRALEAGFACADAAADSEGDTSPSASPDTDPAAAPDASSPTAPP